MYLWDFHVIISYKIQLMFRVNLNIFNGIKGKRSERKKAKKKKKCSKIVNICIWKSRPNVTARSVAGSRKMTQPAATKKMNEENGIESTFRT